MRGTTDVMTARGTLPLPRGWIILGAAIASWALFVGLSTSLHLLFMFVVAAV